jgi:hypothetical protein
MKTTEHFRVRRVMLIPWDSKLTDEAIQQLDNLLEFSSAEEYRNTLIEIYHTYIQTRHKMLPVRFAEMAGQMQMLIDFFLGWLGRR